MTTTETKTYDWGKLAVRADWANAASPIRYATDTDIEHCDFDATVFQVADARHDTDAALDLVNEWLANQAA